MALEFLTSIIQAYPKTSVIIISIAVTFLSMLVTKYFTNQGRMRELKEVQKRCQVDLKATKDPKRMAEIQKEMMSCSMEMMKFSFKPMFITFIPIIVLIAFIRKAYTGTDIAGTWIWYYIITSLIASFPLRKILKIA